MQITYFWVVKHWNSLITVILLLGMPVFLRAQEVSDYETYERAAGTDMPLLRSRVADSYGNYFNGTYLADTLGFLAGEIVFEGKTYKNLHLNLDAVLQHVLLQQEGSPIILDLGRDRVQSFSRGRKTYVNLPAQGYDLPAAFYELMAQGRGAVYKRVNKIFSHLVDLNHDAREFIGYDDPNYRSDIFDYYQHKEYWYWIKEDGTIQRLRNKRKIRNAIQTVQSHETH